MHLDDDLGGLALAALVADAALEGRLVRQYAGVGAPVAGDLAVEQHQPLNGHLLSHLQHHSALHDLLHWVLFCARRGRQHDFVHRHRSVAVHDLLHRRLHRLLLPMVEAAGRQARYSGREGERRKRERD